MAHCFFFRAFGGRRGRRLRGRGTAAESAAERSIARLEDEVLAVLWDAPRSGADVMRGLAARTGVRPEPSTVYPTLQYLTDCDLIRSSEADGKTVYALTDKGSAALAQHSTPEALPHGR